DLSRNVRAREADHCCGCCWARSFALLRANQWDFCGCQRCVRPRDIGSRPQLFLDERMDGSGEDLPPINVSFSSFDLLFCGSESQEGIPDCSRDIELGQGEFGVGTVLCRLSDIHICSAVPKIKWFPGEQDPCHT